MGLSRQCLKTGCTSPSVATLTYVYRDSTVVLGPLATYAEPHTYDLCHRHAEGLTAPRGWEVVRLTTDSTPRPPSTDDLLALADAVREAGRARPGASRDRVGAQADDQARHEAATGAVEVGRKGHLRVLRDS
ncbi:DUF3499 domain-containing protein [Lapillicoccus sp.]|uniref:DUF3499 domain-containing protein n=1 Tax=Lapillicoccus sp. TaxID=1909287 RepID=UPI0027BE2EEA|nr:DUF3499 domain-containing protein [Actinomycetota bacterium]